MKMVSSFLAWYGVGKVRYIVIKRAFYLFEHKRFHFPVGYLRRELFWVGIGVLLGDKEESRVPMTITFLYELIALRD